MDKEKRIAELAEILYDFGADKKPNNADYHRADYLINLGYGNVKQAVKEFAEKLKQKIKSVSDIDFTGKTEKQLYQRRGMEEGLQMACEIVDELITQLYGEENK